MVISVKLLGEQGGWVKQPGRTGVSVNPADLQLRACQPPEHYT
jgi:hypothetical protein